MAMAIAVDGVNYMVRAEVPACYEALLRQHLYPLGGRWLGGEAMKHKSELTLSRLRKANMARLPLFRNSRGEPAHSMADGSDWALSAWCNAVTGELGELASLIKKIERGDFTKDAVQRQLSDELADVVIYLDILASRCGVDLGSAVASKFNLVSDKLGSDIKL
ncbi:MazG-like family protein [Nostoc sp. CHAB 5715]|uniref:MazG-like family protein n=1 Tax=Nostoc sp. CHAB 5715 TaxID=2780400 RepID=UPI001E52FCEC|nr:MazG-like family protein [Nostoc sp. CHAB 5715]MCC5625995.1 MazG-like family protein [Nostoc sp. CHAB 5715]